jgi:glucan 1,3-beta-glucosidase
MNGVYTATLQKMTFQNCNFGVDINESAGMVSLVDSSVSACNAGVNVKSGSGAHGSVVIDHLDVSSGAVAVKASDGTTLLSGGVPLGQTWIHGNL